VAGCGWMDTPKLPSNMRTPPRKSSKQLCGCDLVAVVGGCVRVDHPTTEVTGDNRAFRTAFGSKPSQVISDSHGLFSEWFELAVIGPTTLRRCGVALGYAGCTRARCTHALSISHHSSI
jgi:hypothetical protein